MPFETKLTSPVDTQGLTGRVITTAAVTIGATTDLKLFGRCSLVFISTRFIVMYPDSLATSRTV